MASTAATPFSPKVSAGDGRRRLIRSMIARDRVGAAIGFGAVTLAVVCFTAPRLRAEPMTTLARHDVTHRIEEARRIVTPNGIELRQKVQIGGIEQWVSIRGADRRNPVLLLVHGGPGYVELPMSWWYSRGWEEYFTVVQWDQRGAGKTYLLNDPAKVGPTMTFERMVADTEEMTDWLRRTLDKKKIFLMGHSWGSYLGFQMATRHPDWLHAYIGVGQLSNGPESERRGWAETRDAAQRAGNSEAVHQLDALAPYFTGTRSPTLPDVFTQRKWLGYYGGAMAYRHESSADSAAAELSPDYTDEEIAHIWDGNGFSEEHLLLDVLKVDLTRVNKVDCPILFFEGRQDLNVNSALAAAWFDRLAAPEKRFVWFEHSAHMPMTEEPGKFLLSLVRYARPIAERAGDAAP
jgi:pimeloyl-ACP methyl ester carboxylesterase